MAAEHPAAFVWSGNAQLRSPVIWVGIATVSGGAWSVDYSQAGFVATPTVTAIPILTAANVYDRGIVSLSGHPTTTACSGYCIRGANLALLGSTMRNAPDGTVVQVMAIGETFTA